MKKTNEMPDLELKDINSAYVGKPNSCMCGCSGTYYYPEVNQIAAGKNRGYEVTDDEVDDAKVKRIYNKMVRNAWTGIEVIEDYIFTLILGKTQYTIYRKEK